MADDLGTLVAKLAADMTDLKKGLAEGRQQFASFQIMIETGAAKIKQVLAFAGVGVGLYELFSKLKQLGSEILDVGGKSELLRASAYALGKHYKISAEAVDYYLNKLKSLGIEQENALKGINNFLKAGLSIDLLPQLAEAAKDLAPTMAMPFNEAFAAIIQSVTKGTPKALAELTPGIKQALQAAGSETKKILDSTILSGTEKSRIMVDFVLTAAAKAKGAGDEVADSYMRQLERYRFAAQEAKLVLFEFLKPITTALLGAQITSWEELNLWVINNRKSLAQLAEILVVYIEKGVLSIKTTINFIATHKELFKVILNVAVAYKIVGYLAPLAATAVAVSGGAAVSASLGWLALAANIQLAVAALAAYMVYKTFPMPDVSAEWAGQTGLEGGPAPSPILPAKKALLTDPNAPAQIMRRYTEAQIKAEVEAAAKRGREESKLAGAKGGKGAAEDLFSEQLKLMEQQRQAEIQAAQSSLDLLKTTNDRKKAELEKSLAEGLIDGRTYYQRLQELQQGETAAALKLIEVKRQAAAQAHEDALADLARQGLSEQALNYRTQAEAAKYAMTLTQLAGDAAKAKLEGEIKVTNELKHQVDVRKQYLEKTEDLNLETAQLLGAVSEQEAKLQKLVLEWQRTKQEAYRAGITEPGSPTYIPGYAAALDANLRAKQGDVRYGEAFRSIGGEFSAGASNLIKNIQQGTMDINKTLVDMFNNIMMATLKPGFDALGVALTNAVKWLLNSLSQALGGGPLFAGGGGGPGYDVIQANRWLGGGGTDAHGGAFIHGVRQAFAGGGIVTRPTLFALAGGAGLMGEAGPEGILPLTRVGGDLGVKALFPGPPTVNIINQTGVEAKGSATYGDDGSLDIILEKKVAGYMARGGELQKTMLNVFNVNKRF